jgi:SAM domain (Sterile alpha motif)
LGTPLTFDQDLKEIGVSSLGHRRQLLRAIAELKIVDKVAPKSETAASAFSASVKMDTAERHKSR